MDRIQESLEDFAEQAAEQGEGQLGQLEHQVEL